MRIAPSSSASVCCTTPVARTRRWTRDTGGAAEAFALELRDEGSLALDDARFGVLAEALRLHSDGLVSDDATIGACWDADRLHLPRVSIDPIRSGSRPAPPTARSRWPRQRRSGRTGLRAGRSSSRSLSGRAEDGALRRGAARRRSVARGRRAARAGRRARGRHAFGTRRHRHVTLAAARCVHGRRRRIERAGHRRRQRRSVPVRQLGDGEEPPHSWIAIPVGRADEGPTIARARRGRASRGRNGRRTGALRSALRGRDAPLPDQGAGDGGNSASEGR